MPIHDQVANVFHYLKSHAQEILKLQNIKRSILFPNHCFQLRICRKCKPEVVKYLRPVGVTFFKRHNGI